MKQNLEKSVDHFEWRKLCDALRQQGLKLTADHPVTFTKCALIDLTGLSVLELARAKSEILALGKAAVPTLIAGITYAVDPPPIFSSAAVANIPIFSMQLLAQRKDMDAVPALIDYIPRYKSDSHSVINGKELHPVVEALKKITGQDYGKDQSAWREWYEKTQSKAGK